MKKIIKAFAMDPVFIVPKILRIRTRIGLIEITSSFGTDANTRPDIADYILNVRLFNQNNGSAGILHNSGLITFGLPVGQTRSPKAVILPVYSHSVSARSGQIRQRIT